MRKSSIDLNADLGEGYGPWSLTDDAGLMPLISSANMACGYHAGDHDHMSRVCALAREHGVSLGAHPGYNDKPHFGRRAQHTTPTEVERLVAYQIGAAQAMAALNGTRIRYVKVHGALSNQSALDPELAAAIARAIAAVDDSLTWLAIAGSAHLEAGAAAGLRTVSECFIDRAYGSDGQLAPRSLPGSVYEDIDTMLAQVEQLLERGTVTAIDGSEIPLACDSLCLHGDGAHALETAAAVRERITAMQIAIAPFCP